MPERRADSQQNIAFFPAFPMLMRYLSVAARTAAAVDRRRHLDRRRSFALDLLLRLARELLKDDGGGAAVTLLAAYPFALFFSAAYTESLFLLTVVGACITFGGPAGGGRLLGFPAG